MGAPVTLRFLAAANKTYTVQYTDTLPGGGRVKLAEVVAEFADRIETVIDPDAVLSRYYRLATPRQEER